MAPGALNSDFPLEPESPGPSRLLAPPRNRIRLAAPQRGGSANQSSTDGSVGESRLWPIQETAGRTRAHAPALSFASRLSVLAAVTLSPGMIALTLAVLTASTGSRCLDLRLLERSRTSASTMGRNRRFSSSMCSSRRRPALFHAFPVILFPGSSTVIGTKPSSSSPYAMRHLFGTRWQPPWPRSGHARNWRRVSPGATSRPRFLSRLSGPTS